MEKERTIRESNHILTLDNNKKAIITGVVEVMSSTDKAVVARTDTVTFQISGGNLRVSKLVPEEKLCQVDGDICKLEYNKSNHGKNFFKRIFK
ncbi:MAG: YabP/YqfC family sporulation protein [Clostridia bacterium]|nr:YabP/YqfC family sporulation protein [Clostridia bacterium]